MCYGSREKLFALHGDFVAKYERSYPCPGIFIHKHKHERVLGSVLLIRCFIFLRIPPSSAAVPHEYGSRMSYEKGEREREREREREKKNNATACPLCAHALTCFLA